MRINISYLKLKISITRHTIVNTYKYMNLFYIVNVKDRVNNIFSRLDTSYSTQTK